MGLELRAGSRLEMGMWESWYTDGVDSHGAGRHDVGRGQGQRGESKAPDVCSVS